MTAYRVTHATRYRYSAPVSLCHNEAHLVPRDIPRQSCRYNQLQIDPAPAVREPREDFFGNRVIYFAIQKPHTVLRVVATSEVVVTPPMIPDDHFGPSWEEVANRSLEEPDTRPFVLDSPLIPLEPAWIEYARQSFGPGRTMLSAVRELNRRIFEDFRYQPGFTTVSTPLAEVLKFRRGVCQDFAHFAIACLRSLGLPARYVSGYIRTIPPPGAPVNIGADASHAWFAIWLPQIGWIDYDPTNNKLPTDQHITLAWGRDYSDVPPLKGVILGGGSHTLEVSVDVKPL